jgi:hypothetical protein
LKAIGTAKFVMRFMNSSHQTAKTPTMGLFMKAESTSAFLKMGIMGFAGSGKTYTAAHTAIGLVEYMQSVGVSYADKPVFFLDTETGSDWVKPQFEAAGIPLFTAKTRAFQDLLASVKEAEKDSSLLLVDSISHFWKEICDSYMKVKKRNRLQFEDWAFLKGEWGKFTDLFVNSACPHHPLRSRRLRIRLFPGRRRQEATRKDRHQNEGRRRDGLRALACWS